MDGKSPGVADEDWDALLAAGLGAAEETLPTDGVGAIDDQDATGNEPR